MKFNNKTDLRKVEVDIWKMVPYYFDMTEDQQQVTRYRILSQIYLQWRMDVDDVVEILPPQRNPFDDHDFVDEWIERHEMAEARDDFELCQILLDAFNDYHR